MGCHQPGLGVNLALYPASHHPIAFCVVLNDGLCWSETFSRREFLSVLHAMLSRGLRVF